MSEVKNVSCNDAHKSLSDFDLLLDVREPQEFAEDGRIDGAISHPMSEGLSEVLNKYEKHQRILFICRSGVRSAKACQIAGAAGFTSCFNLAGGMLTWIEEGHPYL